LMLIALGGILMAILSAWTFKILRQKNIFRLSSQIDGLTRISNRAHFVESGVQVFKTTQKSAGVVLFDMDHFKTVNDTFGHAAGDWVLKTVAASVKSLLPKGEMLGRLGGEEFAFFVIGLNQTELLALAERCRAAIASIDSQGSGFSFPMTASFGVAVLGGTELCGFEETLAAADKALYFSKTEGRNRVSLYQ
jgi:diguanylate cyclase (GGDEF)-like protein